MKVDLNYLIKDLDGKELDSAHMGKTIANLLVNQTKGEAIKYWGWALKLNDLKELELDKSDFDTLKTFIKDSDQLFIIAKAQILETLGDFKD